MNIVLIGMPGCGKTTFGSELSKKLNFKFIDMDKYIEEKTGNTITELFENGEEYFRTIEKSCAIELSKLSGYVISTGGGIVKIKENMECLKSSGFVIFINRPLEYIVEDVDVKTRPLLSNGIDKIYNLYEERFELYKKYCDIEIKNEKNFEKCLDEMEKYCKKIKTIY